MREHFRPQCTGWGGVKWGGVGCFLFSWGENRRSESPRPRRPRAPAPHIQMAPPSVTTPVCAWPQLTMSAHKPPSRRGHRQARRLTQFVAELPVLSKAPRPHTTTVCDHRRVARAARHHGDPAPPQSLCTQERRHVEPIGMVQAQLPFVAAAPEPQASIARDSSRVRLPASNHRHLLSAQTCTLRRRGSRKGGDLHVRHVFLRRLLRRRYRPCMGQVHTRRLPQGFPVVVAKLSLLPRTPRPDTPVLCDGSRVRKATRCVHERRPPDPVVHESQWPRAPDPIWVPVLQFFEGDPVVEPVRSHARNEIAHGPGRTGMPERMPLHVVVTRVVVPVPVLRRRPPCGIFTPTRT